MKKALSILAAVVGLRNQHHMGRTRYPKGHRPTWSRYRPHQGEREVARRLRQAERDKERRAARGGFSRRGLPCG